MQDGREKKMESSFEYKYYTSTAPALYIHILSQVGNPCNKKKHHKKKQTIMQCFSSNLTLCLIVSSALSVNFSFVSEANLSWSVLWSRNVVQHDQLWFKNNKKIKWQKYHSWDSKVLTSQRYKCTLILQKSKRYCDLSTKNRVQQGKGGV